MLPIVSGALLLPKIDAQLFLPHAPVLDVPAQPFGAALTVAAQQGADQAAAYVLLLGHSAISSALRPLSVRLKSRSVRPFDGGRVT